jgi:hypothetical protein
MRFRTKFGLLEWVWVAVACMIVLILLLDSGHKSPYRGLIAAYWVLWAFVQAVSRFFVYWVLDSSGLRERRFWNTREIPWNEVTRVGSLNPKQPASGLLEVDFARPAPMSDRGHILAHPQDREHFIRALRRFAPQADFEV